MEHTEKVIEEMLENLLQSDDDVESYDGASTVQAAKPEELELELADKARLQQEVEQIYDDIGSAFEQLDATTIKPLNAHNLTIAEELRKMREEYPINADSEETLTTPSTIALKTLSAAASDSGGDISPKTSSSKISYDAEQIAYRNEVSRVLFAGKTENCPAENTPEYYAAAQEYAVYGNDFMDFLPDFEQVYARLKQRSETPTVKLANGKLAATANVEAATNAGTKIFEESSNAKIQKSRFDFANRLTDGNLTVPGLNEATLAEQQNEQQQLYGSSIKNSNFQSFQPRAGTTVALTQQKPLSAVATAGAATAATYYQLCSNLQRPSSTPPTAAASSYNSAASTAAVSANMLLSNTHSSSMQYQPPPQVFQHQQFSAASSLSQAAYNVASNVRFTPNAPLLPLTTATSAASSGVNVGGVNVYERMVYAQLLQQQLIKTRQQQLQQQQQQQAIAAATIFQQQLQRQQQLKMAAAMQQHVAHVANANVATTTGSVDLTVQRSSPNPQVVNFSATLTSTQSRSNANNKLVPSSPTNGSNN